MNQTAQNVMKVSEAFKIYQECKRNNTLVQNMLRIFDSMTQYILNSSKIDYNFDLLKQLSLIKENKSISQHPEEYLESQAFREFFKTYSKYLDVRKQNVSVIKSIINASNPLIVEAKMSIYKFIWSLPGFRRALINKEYHYHEDGKNFNGSDYMTKSIFSPMLSTGTKYVSNQVSFKTFKPLSDKMGINEFEAVLAYFIQIVRANKPYTFDNPQNYASTLSSYDLLGTVLILAIKLIQNNPEHVFVGETHQITVDNSELIADIWNLINYLYFTVFEIKRSTTEAYKYNNDEIMRLIEEYKITNNMLLTSRIQERRKLVDSGKAGLERLVDIIKLIDVKFVDSIIFANMDYALLDSSIIFRLRQYILERKIKKNTDLSKSVCQLTKMVLESRTPPDLKCEYVRLVMAYDLHKEYSSMGEEYLETLTTYLLTDARKLKDIYLIHAMDVLDNFSGSLFIFTPGSTNSSRCTKIIRLYLGYLKDVTELYQKIASVFITCSDLIKPNIIADMVSVAGYCKDLIVMIGQIGNEALEYIEPLIVLIDKVTNTKNFLNIPENFVVDPSELSVIDQIRPTYIEKFRPLLIDMLKKLSDSCVYFQEDLPTPISDEWREIYSMYYIKEDISFSESVFRLVLRSDTVKLLKELFNIDLAEEKIMLTVIESDISKIDGIFSEDLDNITCDIIVSPVAIPIGTGIDDVVVVNQRTMHTIILGGTNPFNRQPITYEQIFAINSKPDVREKLDAAMDFIRKWNS